MDRARPGLVGLVVDGELAGEVGVEDLAALGFRQVVVLDDRGLWIGGKLRGEPLLDR